MTLTRSAQRALLVVGCAALAAIYALPWLAPSVAVSHDAAARLVAAKTFTLPSGAPPLFPALLALFARVSARAQWLKSLPLLCAFGWLLLTHRLLRRMGAPAGAALLLVWLAAASPVVVYLSTSLLPETLFALLATAALLALLGERPALAGICAGLAAITGTGGLALIAACLIVLLARRRFRGAVTFTIASMLFVAPWLGWSLVHAAPPARIPANEQLQAFAVNAGWLFGAPFALLTGISGIYPAVATGVVFAWAVIRRRQLVPDLFLLFFCGALIFRPGPPQRALAAALPLLLWILWRAFGNIRIREAMAAMVVIVAALALWADGSRVRATLRYGTFPASAERPNDLAQMNRLFAFIRAHTPADAVILANLDPVFALNTGRKSVRGFQADPARLWYGNPNAAVTPDRLFTALAGEGAGYVALTPDRDRPESPAYHHAVEALERGGILEPVPVPGLDPDYRLLRTVSLRFR